MMLDTKYMYQDLRSYGFRQEDSFMFFTIKAYVKHVTPGVGEHFWPKGMIQTNLVEVHKVMLHTKYQASGPYGFR